MWGFGMKDMTNKKRADLMGKLVTFRAITRWCGRKTTRQVRGVRGDGAVFVKFGGWLDFIVKPDEIICIEG